MGQLHRNLDTLAIAALSTIGRLWLIWSGLCERGLLADDAYYYFTIAHNIAGGFGPTFDRLSLTNGFHPLWQFTIVPFFSITHAIWTPVRLALTLAVLFDAITGLVLAHVALRMCSNRWSGTMAALTWFLFPVSAMIGLRGMEASLSAMLVLLTMWGTLRARDHGFTPVSAIGCGLLLGLCGLARTDNFLSVGVVVVACALLARPQGLSLRHALGWVALAGLCAAAFSVPWFYWNVKQFGSLVQVSGQMKHASNAMFGALPAWDDSLIASLRVLTHRLLAPIVVPVRFLVGEEFRSGALTVPLTLSLLVLLAVPSVVLVLAWWRRQDARPILVFAAVFVATHVFVLALGLGSYASWYSLPVIAMMVLLSSVAITSLSERVRGLRLVPAAGLLPLAAVSVLMYGALFRTIQHQKSPAERLNGRLADIATGHPGETVGAFNAGAVGYVAIKHGVRVVNLDGLVNNEVFRAMKDGRYVSYVVTHVDIMFEPPSNARVLVQEDAVHDLEHSYAHHPDGLWYRKSPASAR